MGVVSVYAPCVGAERPHFFSVCMPAALLSVHGLPCLVGGDFNCVADVEDPAALRLSRGSSELLREQRALGLVDALLALSPQDLEPTHIPAAGGRPARLDRWLISSAEAAWVERASVQWGGPAVGDHAAVTLRLRPPGMPLSAPRRWTFPLHLLGDECFERALRQHIAAFLAARAAGETALQRWEQLKWEVRQRAVQYAADQANDSAALRRQLQAAERQARFALLQCPSDSLRQLAYRAALARRQAVDREQAATRVAQAEALWHDYGEQSTFWFHRLVAPQQARSSSPVSELPQRLRSRRGSHHGSRDSGQSSSRVRSTGWTARLACRAPWRLQRSSTMRHQAGCTRSAQRRQRRRT